MADEGDEGVRTGFCRPSGVTGAAGPDTDRPWLEDEVLSALGGACSSPAELVWCPDARGDCERLPIAGSTVPGAGAAEAVGTRANPPEAPPFTPPWLPCAPAAALGPETTGAWRWYGLSAMPWCATVFVVDAEAAEDDAAEEEALLLLALVEEGVAPALGRSLSTLRAPAPPVGMRVVMAGRKKGCTCARNGDGWGEAKTRGWEGPAVRFLGSQQKCSKRCRETVGETIMAEEEN